MPEQMTALDRLRIARAKVDEEINSLMARRDAFDEALAIIGDAGVVPEKRERFVRGAVKDTALRLLQTHAEHGLTVVELLEVAANEGIKLDRGSISSLLSKLKSLGTLVMDVPTSKYRPAPPTPVKMELRNVR